MELRLKQELDSLLTKALEDIITQEQQKRLNSLVRENPEALQYCVDFYTMAASLRRQDRLAGVFIESSATWQGDQQALLDALLQCEQTAPSVEICTVKPEPPKTEKPDATKATPSKINKVWPITALTSLAALLFVVIMANISPPPVESREVATLVDCIYTQWAPADQIMEIGTRLRTYSPALILQGGIAKLAFDNQAQLVIEAPAQLSIVDHNRVRLYHGMVFAQVPERATGFTITTENSTIIDIGTEFGVRVDKHGDTELHVLEGKTELVTASAPHDRPVAVTVGKAKKITGAQATIADIPCNNHLFVRAFSVDDGIVWRGEPLDLADIVSGGNGFGSSVGTKAIHPVTGRWRQGLTPPSSEWRKDTYHYMQVKGSPYIDGVFGVDPAQGPVVVDSTGHVFTQCPTTCGYYWAEIVNGSRLKLANNDSTAELYPLCLNGQYYNTAEHPSILLHPNCGITFDLQAIRQTLPGCRLKSLEALCGISQLVPTDPKADFWVLIDGEIAFEKRAATKQDPPTQIHIPLNEQQRFLTLITTDGDQDLGYDWTLFAEPVLVLEQRGVSEETEQAAVQ